MVEITLAMSCDKSGSLEEGRGSTTPCCGIKDDDDGWLSGCLTPSILFPDNSLLSDGGGPADSLANIGGGPAGTLIFGIELDGTADRPLSKDEAVFTTLDGGGPEGSFEAADRLRLA